MSTQLIPEDAQALNAQAFYPYALIHIPYGDVVFHKYGNTAEKFDPCSNPVQGRFSSSPLFP
jgi:hypothetical protein